MFGQQQTMAIAMRSGEMDGGRASEPTTGKKILRPARRPTYLVLLSLGRLDEVVGVVGGLVGDAGRVVWLGQVVLGHSGWLLGGLEWLVVVFCCSAGITV